MIGCHGCHDKFGKMTSLLHGKNKRNPDSFCRKTQLYKNWQTGILGWETMLFSHLVYRYQITAPDTVYIRLLFSVFGESRRQSWAEEDTKR